MDQPPEAIATAILLAPSPKPKKAKAPKAVKVHPGIAKFVYAKGPLTAADFVPRPGYLCTFADASKSTGYCGKPALMGISEALSSKSLSGGNPGLCAKHWAICFKPKPQPGHESLTQSDFTWTEKGWGCTVTVGPNDPKGTLDTGQKDSCAMPAPWTVPLDSKAYGKALCPTHFHLTPPGPKPPTPAKTAPPKTTAFVPPLPAEYCKDAFVLAVDVGCEDYRCGLRPYNLPGHSSMATYVLADDHGTGCCMGCYESLPGTMPGSPKSQKARGVRLLGQRARSVYFSTASSLKAKVWPHDKPTTYPTFARPAPMRPRHGFVDSRLIKTATEFEALTREVLAAEAEGEIICMPFITPRWSAIINPHGITLGPGNDGATSGYGCIAIPAQGKDLLKSIGLKATDVGIEHDPYLEFVAPSTPSMGRLQLPELVQVRDGEAVPLMDRYVPERIKVCEVVEAEGDLLEWERRAASFKPCTVVWHPGGSLQSHYAVHCILNRVPILCTKDPPLLDSTLEAVTGPPTLTTEHHRAIAAAAAWARGNIPTGIDAGTGYPLASSWCRLSVGTLHAMALWGTESHLLLLRGMAAATLAQLATAACIAEDRHYQKNGPGREGYAPQCPVPQGGSREARYTAAYAQAPAEQARWVALTHYDYSTPGWEGSYGGTNWATCASATMRLNKALGTYMAVPSNNNWTALAMAMNGIVNVAHNGGTLLNKYMEGSHFDTFAKAPAFAFLCHKAYDFLSAPPTIPPIGPATRKVGRALRDNSKAVNLPPPKATKKPDPEEDHSDCQCDNCIDCGECNCDDPSSPKPTYTPKPAYTPVDAYALSKAKKVALVPIDSEQILASKPEDYKLITAETFSGDADGWICTAASQCYGQATHNKPYDKDGLGKYCIDTQCLLCDYHWGLFAKSPGSGEGAAAPGGIIIKAATISISAPAKKSWPTGKLEARWTIWPKEASGGGDLVHFQVAGPKDNREWGLAFGVPLDAFTPKTRTLLQTTAKEGWSLPSLNGGGTKKYAPCTLDGLNDPVGNLELPDHDWHADLPMQKAKKN